MGTARVNREEGGDDVKSSWPLCPGLQACYNGRYKGLQTRESQLIPENRPQFGSESATRLREAGIASNRGSERRGEYVLGLDHSQVNSLAAFFGIAARRSRIGLRIRYTPARTTIWF